MTANNTLSAFVAGRIADAENMAGAAFRDMTAAASVTANSTSEKTLGDIVNSVVDAMTLQGLGDKNTGTNLRARIGAARAFHVSDAYGVNAPRIVPTAPKTAKAQADAAAKLDAAYRKARADAAAKPGRKLSAVQSEHGRMAYLKKLSAAVSAWQIAFARGKESDSTKQLGAYLVALQTESGMTAFVDSLYAAHDAPAATVPAPAAPVPAPAAPAAPVPAPAAPVPAPAMPAPAAPVPAPAAPVPAPAMPAPAAPVPAPAAPAPTVKGKGGVTLPAAPQDVPEDRSDRSVQDVPAITTRAQFNAALAQLVAFGQGHMTRAEFFKALGAQWDATARHPANVKADSLPGDL